MNPSCDIAVVMPAYRSGPWLEEALESVLAQTRAPREIIVVDDGSPESIADRLRPRFGDRVTCLRQENAGPGTARNTGAAHATCTWLAFLDDDDLWLPQKLERQLDVVASNPEVVLVGTNSLVFGEGIQERPKLPLDAVVDLSFEGMLRGNSLTTSTVLLRRDAFEAVGGFDPAPEFFAVEDFDLWLRVLEHAEGTWIAEPLGRYRVRSASISDPGVFARGVDHVLSKVLARRGQEPSIQRLVRRRQALQRREAAWEHLEQDRVGEAWRAIRYAVRRNPSDLRAWKLLAKTCLASLPLRGRRTASQPVSD